MEETSRKITDLYDYVRPEEITHVLYHANCADGMASAAVAFGVRRGNAEYIPCQYQEKPTHLPFNSKILMVDFSYPKDTLHWRARDLVILDHHKTAQEALADMDNAWFDQEECGAVLAWKYFHPGEPIPLILQYVKDRDLWQWRLAGSQEINTYLGTLTTPQAFWDEMVVAEADPVRWLAQTKALGAALIRYKEAQIGRDLERVVEEKIGGHWVPTINSCHAISELAHRLLSLKGCNFVAIWFEQEREGVRIRNYCLRSVGEFDVSKIAQVYGGGGHRNAAGFTVPVSIYSNLAPELPPGAPRAYEVMRDFIEWANAWNPDLQNDDGCPKDQRYPLLSLDQLQWILEDQKDVKALLDHLARMWEVIHPGQTFHRHWYVEDVDQRT